VFSLKRGFALFTLVLLVLAGGSCARDEVTGLPGISASRSGEPSTLLNVILFSTEDFGTPTQLATMKPDGSDRQRITNDDHAYLEPTISPDGRRIAVTRFTSDGRFEGIFLMNADGSGQSLLVNRSTIFDGEAAWSPDGRQIAFQSLVDGPFGAFGRIFVINVDGTGLRQVSPDVDPNDYQFDGGPSWAPDGTRLVFTRGASLYVVNADGTGFAPLPIEDFAQNPSWSPDGRIAYQALDGPGNIRIRNVDGSNPVTVSSVPEQQGWPRWSPDGRQLVFYRVLGGVIRLFVINDDGTGETRLSFGAGDYQPTWSPFPRSRSDAGIAIELTPTDTKLAPAETRQFTAVVRTTNGDVLGNASVTWSSSDPAVTTVTAAGLVTGVSNGVAQIQATFGGETVRASVRVADRVLRNVILYSTDDEFGIPEFEVVRPDGTGRRRLTADRFGYQSPDISPDGRRIAFATFFSVFIINADAAGISEGFTQLFFSFGSDAFPGTPAWSPDGSLVAFSAVGEGPFGPARRILVVNADGSGGLRQVTPDDPDPGSTTSDDGPTWSPDGTRLVFTRNGVLHVINADGTSLTPLPNEDLSSSPDWSPDGTRVAYASPTGGIRIRNADGSNPFTVTTGQDSHPRWSPDKRQLVFVRVVDGKSQLFIVNADGTGETKLSAGTAQETGPSWSPLP
jgi:TolB protein